MAETHNNYAVAVYKRNQVVGHIPRIISAACSVFIQKVAVLIVPSQVRGASL